MTFDMLHVRLHGREVYENIVNVSDHELAQNVSKDVTDQALKDRRCTRRAIWHHKILEVARGDAIGHFPFGCG